MRPSRLAALLLPLLLISTSMAACLSNEDDPKDLSPPYIDIQDPHEGDILTGTSLVLVDVRDSSDISYVCFMVDGQEMQNGTLDQFLWDTALTPNGEHFLEVVAVDTVGNRASEIILVDLFNNLVPPTISFDIPVTQEPLNEAFTLYGKAADAEELLVKVQYDLDDRWLDLWKSGTGVASVSWQLDIDPIHMVAGEHLLRLRAFDGLHYSSLLEATLDINHWPTAVISSPVEGQLYQHGQETILDAGDTIDEDELTYTWESTLAGVFYEGNEAMISHVLGPGEHGLTLTVDDGRGGIDTASSSVIVNVGPSLQVNSPAWGAFLRGDVDIRGNAWDPDDSVLLVELSLDEGDWFGLDDTEEWEYAWDTTQVADGDHSIALRVSDTREGVSEMEPQDFIVDNTAPEVEWPYDDEVLEIDETFIVELTASDATSGIESVIFRLDDELVQSDTQTRWEWDTMTTAEGEHTVEAEILDQAGNRAGPFELSVLVDNKAPKVTWLGPLTEYLGGEVTLEVEVEETGSGIDYVAFAINDEEVANGTATGYDWDTTLEEDGPEYLLEVRAADEMGHVTCSNLTVFVDNTPPELTITNPPDGENMTGQVDVGTAVVENGSGVARYAFSLDGVEVLNSSANHWDWDTTLADEGRHDLTVTCWDRAGNWHVEDIVVYLDHTPPQVSDLEPGDGSELDGAYTARFNAIDLGSGMDYVEFYLDSALVLTDDETPWQWSFDTDEHSEGNHTLSVWAYDRAGNRDGLTATYFFGDVEQPVVSDPHTNYLQTYDVAGIERINLAAAAYAAAPYLAPLVPNHGVTPSIGWNGSHNPKNTLEPNAYDTAKFSGRLALSYWDSPTRAIVVDSYARALLMGPLAGLADIPILLYDSRYTDEALTKLDTIYAPQIVVCGSTPYNDRGVTVLDDDDVAWYTLEYARFLGIDIEYIVATNPDDDLGAAETPHLSALASSWAAYHQGLVVLVPANANQIDTLIHDAYDLLEANDMTPRFMNIIGDDRSVPMMRISGTPSDNQYANRDSDRFTVEVANGRILAKELSDQSYYFDRIVNYQDYLDPGDLRATRNLDPLHWSNNGVIYMGWAAEFAEDSENHCRERMWAEGQFNTQDDTDKAHGGMKMAMMQDFAMSNYIIINADHGMPTGTVTWSASDLLDLHPAIFFGVSCSVGRIDVGNPKSTLTYTIMEKGSNT